MAQEASSSGYPVDWFLEPQILKQFELQCSVCLHVVRDAATTSCGHIFCASCLATHEASRRAHYNSITCPNCRQCYTSNYNTYLRRVVQQLKIRCPETCGWTGQLSDLGTHQPTCTQARKPCTFCHETFPQTALLAHRETCDRRTVPCPTPGCNATPHWSTLQTHLTHCDYLSVTCRTCQQEYKRREEEKHKQECTTTCPLRCGAVNIKTTELQEHLRHHCTKSNKECPYRVFGCKQVIPHAEYEQHIRANALDHAHLLTEHKGFDYFPVLYKKCLQEELKSDALINAIRKRSTLVNALLHLDFPLEHVDASGDTALSWAAYLDQPLTVMMLCSKGANVNHRNNKGSTPLLEACRNHSLDSARLLVSCGADVHTKDLDGRDCAFYRGTSIWEQLSQGVTLHLREETQPRPADP